jgi:hypothetical protein
MGPVSSNLTPAARRPVSDGLSIDGVGTWIAATVIVWVAALLAAFILPFLGLRKFLESRRD